MTNEKSISIPNYEKAGVGPNEFRLRVITGRHIGGGKIAFGMYGQPDMITSVSDYHENPPLIPEEFYTTNPEREEALNKARKMDEELFTKKGKVLKI